MRSLETAGARVKGVLRLSANKRDSLGRAYSREVLENEKKKNGDVPMEQQVIVM